MSYAPVLDPPPLAEQDSQLENGASERPLAADDRQRAPEGIRVLIADDDPLTRRMVGDELAAAGMEVVAEVRDGDEAVAKALELRPDLVLMDIVMPGCDGITATRRLMNEAPEIQIVILSVIDNDELGLLALRCGAAGFLSKDIDLKALPRVVRGVDHGEAAIKRTLTRRLIGEYRATPERVTPVRANGTSLSPREHQVLELLREGRTTESISDELGLAVETVRGHVKSILRKLGVHSRREAIDSTRSEHSQAALGIPADIAAAIGHYAT
jgi:two-component system nitrate/nitrite response regulator NarL